MMNDKKKQGKSKVWVVLVGILLFSAILGFLLLNNNHQGESVDYTLRDDVNVESSITSYLRDGNLIIEYDNPNNEKIWIEGLPEERYLIDKKITIYDYSNEQFNLHIGDESDVYEFGSPIGYEFLDNGSVVHIWNNASISDYYFEKDSGIQLTNHYEDYWTKNIFCIGYYNNGEWNKIACADELTNFEKSIETDNLTYVNATLWKDIEYGIYDLRLGVQYHLGLNDENLSITIYGKNIGIDIPFDLGFAWKVTDWDIPSNETDDYMVINNSAYLIKGTYDNLLFKDMEESYFKGRDSTYDFGGEFLRVDWNENLNYAVKMFGNGVQEDFYVALLINAGHFNPEQEKQTTFQWIDAVVIGTNAGFVTVAPTGDPAASTGTVDNSANAQKDIAPTGAVRVTEIGWWADTATEAANFEVGIYTDEGAQEPENLLSGESRTNAKGTTIGWKRVTGLDISITAGTAYWITFQLDNTATATKTSFQSSSERGAYKPSSTLPSSWGTSTNTYTGTESIYAVWEEGEAPPTYSDNQTNNTEAGKSTVFAIKYNDDTALNPNGGYIFSTNNSGSWINDSLVMFTSTPEWANVTKILPANVGNRTDYRWYANDSAGNVNNTEIFSVITTAGPDITPPYFTTIPNNESIFYLNETMNVTFVGTDETGFSGYFINDTTNFRIGYSSGFLVNDTPLSAGNYAVNVSINDTANNLNWTIFTLEVNQSLDDCEVFFNESTPITFPEQFQAFHSCDSAYTLYLNGTSISNGSTVNGGANYWNVSVQRTDTENYTNTFDDEFFTVSKATPSGSLTNNESWTETYPTSVTIGLSESNSQDGGVTYIVWRDNIEKATGESVLLGVSTYDYILNTSGGANYSSASLDTETLTINSDGNNCAVFFNTTSPIVYPETFTANTNCDSAYTLYLNGSSISNASIVNSGKGAYNISVQRTDTENYTSTFSQEQFIVNGNPGNCQVLFNVSSPHLNTTAFITFTDCTTGFQMYIEGSIIGNNSQQYPLNAGTYNYSVFRNVTGNYSNIFDQVLFVVSAPAAPIPEVPSPHDDFTKVIAQIIQALLVLSAAVIILLLIVSFYEERRTLGEMFSTMLYVGIGTFILILLMPIMVSYIASMIN